MEISTRIKDYLVRPLGIKADLRVGYYYTKPRESNTLFYFGINGRDQYKCDPSVNLIRACKELNSISKDILSQHKGRLANSPYCREGESVIQSVERLVQEGSAHCLSEAISLIYTAPSFDYIRLEGEFELYDDCGVYDSLSRKCLWLSGGYLIPAEAGDVLGGNERERVSFSEYELWTLRVVYTLNSVGVSIQLKSMSNWVLDYRDTTYFKGDLYKLELMESTGDLILEQATLEQCKQVGKFLKWTYLKGMESGLNVVREGLEEMGIKVSDQMEWVHKQTMGSN